MMNTFASKLKNVDKEKLYKIIVILVIILGSMIRIIGIDKQPSALNVDEISSGYEAFSILHYGIDRNGKFLPVFLQAWGSGQNALLTYLIIPFMTILGTNILSVRLPMAIISSISLIVMYKLLRKIGNKKIALIGLIFFAICPWHIMKSRWGLESNLFPDLILIATYLMIKGLEDKKTFVYYIAFVVFGLSAYAYGTSYFFLPVFIIPVLIILLKQRKITIKRAILSLLVVAITALPIMGYVIINTFDLNEIKLPFLTIPRLQVNRYEEITSIFSSGFITTTLQNLKDGLKVVVTQNDNLPWNSIKESGTMYLFSGIFTIIGIIFNFHNKTKDRLKYGFIINVWLIVSILIMLVVEPNINRLNIIMIPIIYYTILGIDVVTDEKYKIVKVAIIAVYCISFISFMVTYSRQDSGKYFTFEDGMEEPIKYVATLEDKQIHITDKIKEPYIYVLFFTEYNTNDFVDTVKYDDENKEYRKVQEFGNYYFEDITLIKNNQEDVYMIKKEDKEQYNLEDFKVTEFEKYIVVEGKEMN